jgi:hypothetical protein
MKRIMKPGETYFLKNYKMRTEVMFSQWSEYVVKVLGYDGGRETCVHITILASNVELKWNTPTDHLGIPDGHYSVLRGHTYGLDPTLRLIFTGENRVTDGMTWKPFNRKNIPLYKTTWAYCSDELINSLAEMEVA